VLATGARWDRTGEDPGRPGAPAIELCSPRRVLDVETALRLALSRSVCVGFEHRGVDEAGGPLPFALAEMAGAPVRASTW
jgi:hypothetical protein